MEEIFDGEKVDSNKLIEYGFSFENNLYSYSKTILNNQFTFNIIIDDNGVVHTKLIDNSTKDEYILHKMKDVTGTFVNSIRNECNHILNDIKNLCFDNSIFKGNQTDEVIKYIQSKYGDKLEFLWEKFKDNAIWRRSDNKKWYALLVRLPAQKLNISKDDIIEIINIKADENEIPNMIDNKSIYPAYHMNKKHWISLLLDYSTPNEKLFSLIDHSYDLAKKK